MNIYLRGKQHLHNIHSKFINSSKSREAYPHTTLPPKTPLREVLDLCSEKSSLIYSFYVIREQAIAFVEGGGGRITANEVEGVCGKYVAVIWVPATELQ